MYAARLLFYQEQTNFWTFIFSDVLRTMFSEIAEGWLDGCLCHWLFYFLIEISNSSPVQKEWYLHCELVSRKTVGLWLIPCSFTKEINSSLRRTHTHIKGGDGAGGVRNISFPENFTHVQNEWPPIFLATFLQRFVRIATETAVCRCSSK